MTSSRLLVTGFTSFPGAPVNPSERAVARLADRFGGDDRVAFHVAETNYQSAFADLLPVLEHHRPDLVLMLGVDRHAPRLRLETRARNARDLHQPDNRGARPASARIDEDGSETLPATWPLAAITAALARQGTAFELSHDAGAYLCNFLFYSVLGHAARADWSFGAGFIHTPLTEDALAAAGGTPEEGLAVLPEGALEDSLSAILETLLDGNPA